VESQKNVGTTFTISLPAADETRPPESGPSPEPIHEQDRAKTPRQTILVVEDDEQSQNYMRIILSKSFAVHLAATAGEARQILENHPVDLILMDLSLRGPTDGIMLTREIRQDRRRADLPIIALTAHAFPRDQQRSLDAGCDAYMAKPFRFEQLMNLIRKYLPD
jgi:CheY-like chemotaxis protein